MLNRDQSAALEKVLKDNNASDLYDAVHAALSLNTSNTSSNKSGANGSDNTNPNPWVHNPQNCKNMKTGEYNARAMSRQSFLAKTDLALAQRFATEAGRKLGDTRAIVA